MLNPSEGNISEFTALIVKLCNTHSVFPIIPIRKILITKMYFSLLLCSHRSIRKCDQQTKWHTIKAKDKSLLWKPNTNSFLHTLWELYHFG